MFNEENKNCDCGRCGGGMGGGMMGMWMHMPKEVKVAKLEKKEAMLKAELEFIGKMKEMVEEKK